ncbi:RagB/SusD family nutrient uptake outer membrane protein [Rudanella paleaurantiibacter]|uniref:RagB/SusD family nutrient uptake outer membrane protein n=2 Tax=Rudanella paleaurantiibacter TaxID=2614655 RepID=A0A7J5U6C3_9BACT|nr:RagB/SusD family nutrient uptake outer membrane protein [Rudanella paleaurantiibacter]
MTMKKIVSILFSVGMLSTLVACKDDFLSFDFTDGNIRDETEIWSSDRNARGFLSNVYFGTFNRYNLDGNGSMFSQATDEAVNSNLSSNINIFNNDTWGSLRTNDDQYANMYDYLRRANIFLEKAGESAINPASDIPRLRGEAFFLRAMFHFELMRRYGPIVLATRSYTLADNLDLPRNTVEEVVAHIVRDCDSAAVMVAPGGLVDQAAGDKGRVSQTAALALKARTLLYAASPLNNPTGDVARWQQAADAARAVMVLNKHSLLTQAQLPNLWNYGSLAYNNEVIFASQTDNNNTLELNNAPVGYDGARGRTNPTQELVDAFDVRSTGKPITDPTSGYNPANPYNDRDPRLGLFIIVNGASFKGRPVEIFEGGRDNVPTNVNNTKTGYYMRKFMSESAFWGVGTAINVRRPWVIFRYAEVLLNYAEALNEAQGPVADVYTAVNQIRSRVGMPALPAGLTKDQMRERIQKERQVELCFEDHRFYDVRRWRKGEQLFNRPVTGMRIVRNGTTLTYIRFQVENRIFSEKMYRFPIPQAELNRAPRNLKQNPGW